jgi:hypothetical protein
VISLFRADPRPATYASIRSRALAAKALGLVWITELMPFSVVRLRGLDVDKDSNLIFAERNTQTDDSTRYPTPKITMVKRILSLR